MTTIGATQQFTAEARDIHNVVIPNVPFAWRSTDVLKATVDPATGLATAVNNGTVTIEAIAGSDTGSASLTVDLSALIDHIVIIPDEAVIEIGATRQFVAEARDINDVVIPNVTFTWSSGNGTLVTIDPTTGLATGLDDGSTLIRATAAGIVGTAVVFVRP